jgi:hypothetical protein
MTLAEYINLLRLSYAQALLISDGEVNVLNLAMESGFGSLSAFNKSFRRIAGKWPSDFRRDYRPLREYWVGRGAAGCSPVGSVTRFSAVPNAKDEERVVTW